MIVVPVVLLTWINVAGVCTAPAPRSFWSGKVLPLALLAARRSLRLVAGLPGAAPPAGSLGAASLLVLFAYAGFENTATPAGEFNNPQRDVPFALLVRSDRDGDLHAVQLVALASSRTSGPRTRRSPTPPRDHGARSASGS